MDKEKELKEKIKLLLDENKKLKIDSEASVIRKWKLMSIEKLQKMKEILKKELKKYNDFYDEIKEFEGLENFTLKREFYTIHFTNEIKKIDKQIKKLKKH